MLFYVYAALALTNGQGKGTIENANGSLHFEVASGKDFTFKTGDTIKTFAEVEKSVADVADSVDGINEKMGDVETSLGQVKTSSRQTAEGLSGTDEAVAKIRRDAECAKEDSLAFAASSAQMSTDLNEKVVGIMAGVLKDIQTATLKAVQSAAAGSPDTTPGPEIIHYQADCPSTGCRALDNTITVAVASKVKDAALMQGVSGIYHCQFSSDNLNAPLYYLATSTNGHTLPCKVPFFDSTKIKENKATWKARVKVFAGLRTEIPYADQDNLADADFTVSSTGPSIATINDLVLRMKDLKKNSDAKYYYAFLIKIADPDSPSDALDIKATASGDDVTLTSEAVDGVADTYKLTILFKLQTPKKSAFKVTVTVEDNHKLSDTTSFGVELTTAQFSVPSEIDDSSWKNFPDGGQSGKIQTNDYFGYSMEIKERRGKKGAVVVTSSHEYPLYSEFSLRESSDEALVFQLYGFALDGGDHFNGGSCDDFFQMGLVWRAQPSSFLVGSNTLEATGALNNGDGVYFTAEGVNGYGAPFNFYRAGASHNSCSASGNNRDKIIQIAWKKTDTITYVVYSDKDPKFARQIAVFVNDVKIYTFNNPIPAGSKNIYSYIGAGYPSNLANKWQNAAPAFRYAAIPL